MAEVEFLGVMVGRSGVRPLLSKIKPLTQMQKPTTVGELRAFVGMANFLRDFVKDFSALVAPITDILHNKQFSTKRARHKSIPWGRARRRLRGHHQRFGVPTGADATGLGSTVHAPHRR